MDLHKVAHAKVQYAVSCGKLKRPNKCEICGAVMPTGEWRTNPWTGELAFAEYKQALIVGHHKDYKYPLDVVWVCRSCHNKIHEGKINVS